MSDVLWSHNYQKLWPYNINGLHFCLTKFEPTHPLVTTTNTRVAYMDIDTRGREINYYGIIKDILEYEFFLNTQESYVSLY